MKRRGDDGDDGEKPGEAGKREGMARAERSADPEWWRCMLICAQEVARQRPWFNTDQVEYLRRERYPNATTHEHRAVGPLMKEAARLGYCMPTDDWFESTQGQNHKRPMRTWWSLIYIGPKRTVRRRRRILDPRQADLFKDEDEK